MPTDLPRSSPATDRPCGRPLRPTARILPAAHNSACRQAAMIGRRKNSYTRHHSNRVLGILKQYPPRLNNCLSPLKVTRCRILPSNTRLQGNLFYMTIHLFLIKHYCRPRRHAAAGFFQTYLQKNQVFKPYHFKHADIEPCSNYIRNNLSLNLMQLIHIPLYKPAVIPLDMVDFKSAIKVIPTPVLVFTDFTRHSPRSQRSRILRQIIYCIKIFRSIRKSQTSIFFQ